MLIDDSDDLVCFVENSSHLKGGIFLLNHKGLLNNIAIVCSFDSSWNDILNFWYFLVDFCDEWFVVCTFDD